MSNAVTSLDESLDAPMESSAASIIVGVLVFLAFVATLFLAYAHMIGG